MLDEALRGLAPELVMGRRKGSVPIFYKELPGVGVRLSLGVYVESSLQVLTNPPGEHPPESCSRVTPGTKDVVIGPGSGSSTGVGLKRSMGIVSRGRDFPVYGGHSCGHTILNAQQLELPTPSELPHE
jgi:hypothetical protein